jgi:hypothetical protein
VQAVQVLHKLSADLGEAVEISPSTSGAIVRAHGLEPARREELASALAGIPGVEFQALDLPQATTSGASNASSSPAPRPKLFAEKLQTMLGGPTGVESFANAVLDEGDAIAIRGHALRKLEQLFPDRSRLSSPDSEVIGAIAAAHRAVLRKHARSLRAKLEPLLGTGGQTSPEPMTLVEQAIELDRLLNAAFAGAHVTMSDDDLASRLRILLKELSL